MLISVCVCTFRRPEGLKDTLLGVQELALHGEPRPDLRVIVVDNEGCERTRDVVRHFVAQGLDLIYVVEHRRGISHARNACLDHVPADARYVAFLDDDLVPRPDWLEELVSAVEATGATAATGPCVAVYDPRAPSWVQAGRFFASPRAKRPANRSRIGFGVMGNILFDAAFLRGSGIRFNDRFGRIGGEDRRFFLDLFKKGAVFVWTERAVVDHFVETKRLTWSYILRREFGIGYASAILERSETPGWARLYAYGINTAARLALKIVLLAPAALWAALRRDAFRRVKPVLDIANLSGRLYGLSGRGYELYG